MDLVAEENCASALRTRDRAADPVLPTACSELISKQREALARAQTLRSLSSLSPANVTRTTWSPPSRSSASSPFSPSPSLSSLSSSHSFELTSQSSESTFKSSDSTSQSSESTFKSSDSTSQSSESTSQSSGSTSQSFESTSSTLSSVVSAPTSRNNPESNIAHHKIAIGIVIPTVVIATVLFGLWAWRKSTWRNRSTVIKGHLVRPREKIQSFLQEKAELEDEPRIRHEAEAQERRYELDGNEIFELQGTHSKDEVLTSIVN